MTFKSYALAAAILAVSPALLAGTALADKGGNGHGKDKSHKESSSYERHYDDRITIITTDRDMIRKHMREDYLSHCPPGLAKKHNGCLPPGQAKKRYVVGYPLPRDVIYVPISDDLRHHLRPAPRGYDYVQVDKDVLLIAEASKKVIDAVTLFSAVGN